MSQYDSAVAQPAVAAPPEPYRVKRRIPSHGATLEGDVLVPFLQSLVTGAIGALLGYAVADRPLVGFGVGFALCWLISLVQSRALLWTLEETWHRDIDRDGVVGLPELPPVRHTVRVEMVDGAGRSRQYVDLPAPPEAIAELARGALAGQSLAEGEWTGAGRPFSVDQYREVRAELLRRGLVAWRNPRARNQGLELTGVGRWVFGQLVEGAEE